MLICGIGKPELSGGWSASGNCAPAYSAVLPEISITRKISTFAERPVSRTTFPLTKITFWSWLIRLPSLGERICTLGSAARTLPDKARMEKTSQSLTNPVCNRFIGNAPTVETLT
jgi:hypothetical protein